MSGYGSHYFTDSVVIVNCAGMKEKISDNGLDAVQGMNCACEFRIDEFERNGV